MMSKKNAETELTILKYLSEKSSEDLDSRHIMTLLDEFQHEGPNGKHQCLVFEPMGATTASLVAELPENKSMVYGKVERYPKWIAKKILAHALRGLAFLHRNGVIHADAQPGNILFSMYDMDSFEENEVKQDEASTRVLVERTDGKTDQWAPQKLFLAQSLHEHINLDSRLVVKLSDLGACKSKVPHCPRNLLTAIIAFWAANPPKDTVTPIALRAPELIFGQKIGTGIDIWAFGCLMFEFLTGRLLFAVMKFGPDPEAQEDADDDHILQLNDVISPLSDTMMEAWPRSSKWYGPNREALNPYGTGDIYIHTPLEKLFNDNRNPEIDDEEAAAVISILRRIFKFDPEERPSADELLKHPWFVDLSEQDIASSQDVSASAGTSNV